MILSNVFAVLVKLRRFLYNVRLLRDSTLGVQVIAIGNLTVGGTGKTPVVEKFARELTDAGRTVAILSRGYRSKPPPLRHRMLNKLLLREDTTPPRIVSDGRSLLLDSETAGDEPSALIAADDPDLSPTAARLRSAWSVIPHHSMPLQIRLRICGAFSPIPPPNTMASAPPKTARYPPRYLRARWQKRSMANWARWSRSCSAA